MKNQQLAVQLLSEPALLAVGDLLGVESRVNTKNNQTYYSMKIVVGNSTVEFDMDAVNFGEMKAARKYIRVIVAYTERFFQNGGSRKEAKAIHFVE